MTSLMRLALCAVAASGLLAGAVALDPPTAASLGVDFWSLPDLARQLHEGEQRAAALDRRDRAVLARLDEKLRLADDLLDGRKTLRQAAARFTELNAQAPVMTEQVRSLFPGRTEEESSCRQVLDFVESETRFRNQNKRSALLRLHEELEGVLREQGDR
jgi:hypothetical protein